MEKRYLIIVMISLGIFLFNSNIQGNFVRVPTSFPAAAPAPIATQQIACPLIGIDSVPFPMVGGGTPLPVSAAIGFASGNMPNALRSTNIGSSTLIQSIVTYGDFVFNINDAPRRIKSFYFHVNDNQPVVEYTFNFIGALNVQSGQQWYLLGRYYTVTSAGMLPNGLYRIILDGCPDQYGNAFNIEMQGNSNLLFVKINGEIIEDVVGNMLILPGNLLQQIRWRVNVDTPPSYTNLDMADGDDELIYMLDEPDGLLNLNAILHANAFTNPNGLYLINLNLQWMLPYS